MPDRYHLEQAPHLVVIAQAASSGGDRLGLLGIPRGKRDRPHPNAERFKPYALADRPRHLCPSLGRNPRERGEIDMGGQVLFPGTVEHISKAMGMDRLQCVAPRALAIMSIINQDSDTAPIAQDFRERRNRKLACWRTLDHLAITIEGKAARREDQTALAFADILPNRKRVEKLAGDDQQWTLASGQAGNVVMEYCLRNHGALSFP